MGYKQIVYQNANRAIELRRKKAEKECEMRRIEVLSVCPGLSDIEREIASCGLDAVKALGMGGDAKAFIESLSQKSLLAQQRKKALLKESGFPEDYLETEYSCPVCKDTGSHDGYFCACLKKETVEQAKALLGENTPVKTSTFDRFSLEYYPDVTDPVLGVSQRNQMGSIYSYCKAYAENFTKKAGWLIMYGGTGLGKTHLSLAIANVVIERGYGVYYGSIQSIMEKLEKEHFGGRRNTDESEKDEILSADLLIIDDLGVEFSTQFTVAALHDIINTRLLKSLPTIISTNLEMEEIYEKYTQRIASRLFGSSTPLAFCGKDIRQIK